MLKIIAELLYFVSSLFCVAFRIPNYETHIPTKQTTVSLIKVKSCNTLLHVIQVRICSYLKSVLRYKFLIWGTCYPYSVFLHEQGCEDLCLLFEVKKGS